jgi:uncharacterized membrane protein YeaQ/YmgE (transglycosylase-associated protein family)
MDPFLIVTWVITGAIAGFLAGLIVRGSGFGLGGNIVVGIAGAVAAGCIFPMLGIWIRTGDPWITEIVAATIGAIILLFVISLLKR